MDLVAELAAAGVSRGTVVALVVVPGSGVALAWGATAGTTRLVPTEEPVAVVRDLALLDPRWTWWSARETAAPLVAAGVRPRTCWDLGAVGRLAYGLRRDDPAAVWAAAAGLPEPPEPPAPGRGPDLLDLDAEGGPVRDDGQLSREWAHGGWAADLASAQRWAGLALRVQAAQEAQLRALPDPRPAAEPAAARAVSRQPPLAVLTAYAESATALLAVELEHDGLPVARDVAAGLLRRLVGERPADATAEAAARLARDARVLARFPGDPVDLRNPAQVRTLLTRIGLDLPDTRSWRLEPHAATSSAVAALLAWRKAERTATTYGWAWLDRHVSADGRLRGAWGAADAAAGRMTAQAGLHNLPAELRPAVRAEPGRVLVRADLGQVEPRVLAVVSGDAALARAAREDDLYAPVAARLGCDRPHAKVAVLAAMYGQTSGTAGEALRGMDRAYPGAMAYLRAAEQAGQRGVDLRTYGGRLLRLGPAAAGAATTATGTAGTAATVATSGPAATSGAAGTTGPAGEHVPAPGAGRYARNAVVQGAAAELFKAWAATVRLGLADLLGHDGQIVLCLHDELLLDVPAERAEQSAAVLRSALESTSSWWAAGSGVRFVAEVAVAASWADAR